MIQTDFTALKTALTNAVGSTGVPIFHYFANDRQTIDRYIVWDEDMESGRISGDGKMEKQVIQGTIDLFTKTEYDTLFDSIQTALYNAGICYTFVGKIFEEGTNKIHYSWVFNLVCGGIS